MPLYGLHSEQGIGRRPEAGDHKDRPNVGPNEGCFQGTVNKA